MTTRDAVTWLFVPGTRDDRFDRAAASGADELILDLEDAVAHDAKDAAREHVATWLDSGGGWVRVNAVGTDWHEQDLASVSGRAGLRGVVVPKAEDSGSLTTLRERLPAGVGLIALVESALGIDQATRMATSGAVDRLAFGSIDFALDIGAEETDDALLFARSALVIASRVGELPAPLDGVTVSTTDDSASYDAAIRARRLGFGGKLCIHPRQVEAVTTGFRPTAAQLDWAARVLESAGGEQGALSVDGQMIDRPILARARSIMTRGGVPE
jgi:citrate lyase subunit beta/citryl-CoA lyase